MKKKEITKLVLKISDGILSTVTDLILWNIFYLTEISPIGSPGNLKRAEVLANKDLEKFNSATIKRTIRYGRKRGFIKKNELTLTKEGKKRLKNIFPEYFGEKKWSGNWYGVSYDIPENKRRLRDILRKKLKQLGFGQFHASFWISPFNFLGEINKIIKNYNLSPYVILVITKKLGQEEARIQAEKVWNLEEINNLYCELLNEYDESRDKHLYFKYLTILEQDPQLPKELLPEDWAGSRAHQIFSEFNSS